MILAFLLMVEAWFYGLGNFVYVPSLVVWSKLFCLWCRLGLMIQALWFYGPSTFTYS